MEENPELCTSFEDLMRLTNMTEAQLLQHTWKFEGLIMYTTEESVLAFLQHKAMHVPVELGLDVEDEVQEEDGYVSIDLHALAAKIKRTGSHNDVLEERRKRPQKKGVRNGHMLDL